MDIAAPAQLLPPLRDDLEIQPGPATLWGQPTWTLHDPAANRFFRLGLREVEILRVWRRGQAMEIAANATGTGRAVQENDILRLGSFLSRNNLLREAPEQSTQRFLALSQARKGFRRLLQSYLFFRIHLVRPDRFLSALAQPLGFVFSAWFGVAAATLCALSLLLLLRQWDLFLATVPSFLNSRGALLSLISVFLAKTLHELAHGLAARRYGLRVTSMGIAVLMLWPVLFTNVTQSWKLNSARKRMTIGIAGVAAELLLAALAGFGWLLFDPGPARDICFVLAATSWIMSLVVNLNPLMRFDGYYLLSDLLGVDNLMERSQTLLRWHLVEFFAGTGDPRPERLPFPIQPIVLIYAVCVRIYRFTLVMSIAALVYSLAFKALGVFLALNQFWSSLIAPLIREIRTLWKRRGQINPLTPLVRGTLVAGALLFLFCWPWNSTVHSMAMLTSAQVAHLHAPFDGILVRTPERADSPVAAGEPLHVQAGELLFMLESPELRRQLEISRIRETASRRNTSVLGMNRQMLRQRLQREAETEELDAALETLEAKLAEARVAAPLDGRVELPAQPLAPGSHVAEGMYLGSVIKEGHERVVAYVNELDLHRIAPGRRARFYPYRPELGGIKCVVESIDATAMTSLESPGFASSYGGDIPTRLNKDGGLVLQGSFYRVTLRPLSPVPLQHQIFGRLDIEGDRSALATRIHQKLKGFLLREFGV
ncbi:MAG: site-2 protease family protein [Desulfovibrio sp.]